MCGRFGLYLEEGFGKRFDISNEIDIHESYNIAPGMDSVVITRNSPNKGEYMRWGLIPPWAKDIRIGYKMINARAETILEKPSYNRPFKNQRCLVPFNFFYEWKTVEKVKTPYLFHDKSNRFLSFAGLYEIAHDADGEEIKSFTIITTRANNSMDNIHDRMPVILSADEETIWLSKESSVDTLTSLLDGYTSKTFESYQVSEKVNSATNNDKSLILPQS